jgi:uncharacterized membrane protein YhhN
MKASSKIIALFFGVLAGVDLTGIAAEVPALHNIAKPLLLPFLLVYLLVSVKKAAGKNIIITALFFSWLGDVFLLLEKPGNSFFIFGLASFLITHLLYIYYFVNTIKINFRSLLTPGAAIVIYGIALVWLLFPFLNDLKIPVIIYALVICTMLVSSIGAYKNTFKPAGQLFVLGAFFFVLSDSLLAINKFYSSFAYAGVWVMLTYCLAQFCIVTAFIKQQIND